MAGTFHKVKRLWKYIRPYWHLELATFLVMAVVAVLTLAIPGAIQYMIDDLIPSLLESGGEAGVWPVVYFGLFLLGVYLANVFVSWTRDFFAARIGAAIIRDIRAELFGHLQRVSLRFYQRAQLGEVLSRLMSDVARIQNLLTRTLLGLLMNVLLLAGILAYIVNIDWKLTLIALVPVPATIWLSNRFGRRLHDISRRLQEMTAAVSARFQEALSATRLIRAFAQEEWEEARATGIMNKLVAAQVKHSVTTSLTINLIHFVNMVGPIVVLAWGTYLVAGGTIKLGALIAFYVLLTYLYSPIRELASVNVEIQSSMASVDRIFEYLDQPRAVKESDHPVTPESVQGAISFRGVSFAYHDDDPVFQDLNLEIAPGEKLAIVGPSGSGKTTIVNLLMRFFDPQVGAVLLDGYDLRELSERALRRFIGLVDQEPLLFRATIFENIAYGCPEADLDQVVASARIANAHGFISALPRGYDTEVGERGITLSGGERQRICLARAIVGNPPVLVLDEATSALDSNSEHMIQDALKLILADKTAIIIAHRFATIQHADRIVALDDGRIVDQGTHNELMQSSELYRELAANQLLLGLDS
jgi:subfamily B ATP-binding cassette protein MsbA